MVDLCFDGSGTCSYAIISFSNSISQYQPPDQFVDGIYDGEPCFGTYRGTSLFSLLIALFSCRII